MAEVLGPNNGSQVVDLGANQGNIFTPGYVDTYLNPPSERTLEPLSFVFGITRYAIYENGTPTKVALFNYITDPSGASNYTAYVTIGGGDTGQSSATPSQVDVK